MNINIEVHAASEQLPDADTDVLVWDSSSPEAQLGALIGDGEWVDAQGGDINGVTHWAEMPQMHNDRIQPP